MWNLALDHGWGHWTRVSASAGAAVATVVVMLLVIFFPKQGEDGKETAPPLALPAAPEREEPQG